MDGHDSQLIFEVWMGVETNNCTVAISYVIAKTAFQ